MKIENEALRQEINLSIFYATGVCIWAPNVFDLQVWGKQKLFTVDFWSWPLP